MSRILMSILALVLIFSGCSDVRSMRRSRDVQGLVKLLENEDPGVRIKAIDALGYVGDTRAVRPLIKVLGDSDPYVREHAARNLGCDDHSPLGCDTDDQIEPLLGLLDDPDPFVRVEAVRSIGEHPLASSREPLEKLVKNETRWEVRHSIAYSLGRIGNEKSVPLLRSLLDDESEQVSKMAEESLRRMSIAARVREHPEEDEEAMDIDVNINSRRRGENHENAPDEAEE